MSPWIHSKNAGISSFTFKGDGLMVNFPVAHAEHTKSSGFRFFFTLTLWPSELLIIFLIILRPGWRNLLCQRKNSSELLNTILRVVYMGVLRSWCSTTL